jgi:hypothetical protein
MNPFLTFFPLLLLLTLFVVDVWVIPRRREREQSYDLDATLARRGEALTKAMRKARETLREARAADRLLREKAGEVHHKAKAG